MNLLALPSRGPRDLDEYPPPAIDHKAEERLRRSSYLALRDISCIASDGVVYLHGCLPSYYLKQVAQEIASGVEGVRHVVNRIEVVAPTSQARPARETWPAVDLSRATTTILRGEDGPPRAHDRRKESATMLVLSRKLNETIVINGDIRITVVGHPGQPGPARHRGPRLGGDLPPGALRPGGRARSGRGPRPAWRANPAGVDRSDRRNDARRRRTR